MAGNMGFECVVRALRSGYKVRRSKWRPQEHIEVKILITDEKIIVFGPTSDGKFSAYIASAEDILAEDWEKYVG